MILGTLWYVHSLRSELQEKNQLLALIDQTAAQQKSRLEESAKEAVIRNERINRTIREISREAQNARKEDNAPFNPALLRTLEQLHELDRRERNTQ